MTVAAESVERTPYGVFCVETFDVGKPPCNDGKIIYMTAECYDQQMGAPDSKWRCPRCGGEAHWSDDNYESYFDSGETGQATEEYPA